MASSDKQQQKKCESKPVCFDQLKVKDLQVHKIKGFSPVEFSDLVICQSGLESQTTTEINHEGLNLTSASIAGSAGSSAGYLTIKLDGTTYKLQLFNNA